MPKKPSNSSYSAKPPTATTNRDGHDVTSEILLKLPKNEFEELFPKAGVCSSQAPYGTARGW